MALTSIMGGRKGGQLSVLPNGTRLAQLRLATKKTQHVIESEVGLSRGQLTRYECGLPSGIKGVIQLARYYNVSVPEVISADGKKILFDLIDDIALAIGASVTLDHQNNQQ